MNPSLTELIFAGMGLKGLESCSLEILPILQKVDKIFIESYTNFTSKDIPEDLLPFKSKFQYVTREYLEEKDTLFFQSIEGKISLLLVPGDPFIATTHNSLRIAAVNRGIKCRVIHNTSIISAAPSISGLSSYKFGRTVTCPFPDNMSEYPYEVIKQNKKINAHTLILLDINLVTEKFLSVNEAIILLQESEEKKKESIISEKSIVIGLARIGYENQFIFAGNLEAVINHPWSEFGPPQALIVCADSLHFAEEEAIKALWGKE